MPSLSKFLEFIGFDKKTMPDEPKATTIVQHRYEEVGVLEKCLKEFGFKNGEWKIIDKNRPGIKIQLPEGRKLTPDQIKKVHDAYVAEHKKRINEDDEEEEEEEEEEGKKVA
ncbi:hypothetical protein G7054_g5878 [Neopestalotiopsis clavispora]|nr:hypothetical protein G7054_g5878 [Neopestalotiopsis clavispora]